MHLTYQSEYSNQVHQLIVSVSKHLFAMKTGRLKFQQKAMDVKLVACSNDVKDHVVHYLIRDHYSGVFYAELYSSKALIPVEDFLLRAWAQKKDYAFCGLPDWLSVPQTVRDVFPTIDKLITDYGVKPVEVTSGFQSGAIRDIKTWEHHIYTEIRSEEQLQFIRSWTPSVTTAMSSDLNGDYRDDKKRFTNGTMGSATQ